MNRRLQQLLGLENITPAKLAEKIGVQPSGISHILSGRNKPSYDFINKLLLHFPSISAEWLITGKGKPYKDQNFLERQKENKNEFDISNSSDIFRNDIISPMTENQEEHTMFNQNDNLAGFDSENPVTSFNISDSDLTTNIGNKQQATDKQELKAHNKDSQLDKSEINNDSRTTAGQISNNKTPQRPLFNKKVRRITLFYSDGSFQEFYPNR